MNNYTANDCNISDENAVSEKKETYVRAEIDIIPLEYVDIVTTSTIYGNSDEYGWV